MTLAVQEDLGRYGHRERFKNGSGINAGDLVIESRGLFSYDTFLIMSTAGVLEIFVCIDGENFTTSPISISDLTAAALTPVLVTEAGKIYGFRGGYEKIQARQVGATAVAGASLLCLGQGR